MRVPSTPPKGFESSMPSAFNSGQREEPVERERTYVLTAIRVHGRGNRLPKGDSCAKLDEQRFSMS